MANLLKHYLVCYQYEGRMFTVPCINHNGDIDSDLFSLGEMRRYLRSHKAEDISIFGASGKMYGCNKSDINDLLVEIENYMSTYEVIDFTVTETTHAGDREETYFTITRVV